MVSAFASNVVDCDSRPSRVKPNPVGVKQQSLTHLQHTTSNIIKSTTRTTSIYTNSIKT